MLIISHKHKVHISWIDLLDSHNLLHKDSHKGVIMQHLMKVKFLIRELTLCKENFMTLPGFTMKDIHDMISFISIYRHYNSNTFI